MYEVNVVEACEAARGLANDARNNLFDRKYKLRKVSAYFEADEYIKRATLFANVIALRKEIYEFIGLLWEAERWYTGTDGWYITTQAERDQLAEDIVDLREYIQELQGYLNVMEVSLVEMDSRLLYGPKLEGSKSVADYIGEDDDKAT